MTTAAVVEESRKIHVKRRGNPLGFWIFEVVLRIFGLRGAHFVLCFVCTHYLIFDRKAVCSVMPYVNHRFKDANGLMRLVHVWRIFFSQGQQLIDRYAGRHQEDLYTIETPGYDKIKDLLENDPRGALLLTAHFGNWQLAMTNLQQLGRTIYVVMRPEDNPAVKEVLAVDHEQSHIKIISPEQHLGGVVEIMNALEDGHIVALMGDRRYGFDTVDVPFLGENAYFPYGAFHIAAMVGCPVISFLAWRERHRHYVIDVPDVFYPRYEGDTGRRNQLREWTCKYVATLENFVKKFPYQCFLFTNVWIKNRSEE